MFLQGKEIFPGCGHEAGRKLLEEMYRQYVGDAMPEIAVSDRGKPYFVKSPWHFSISHSKRHVFCALSKRKSALTRRNWTGLSTPNWPIKSCLLWSGSNMTERKTSALPC